MSSFPSCGGHAGEIKEIISHEREENTIRRPTSLASFVAYAVPDDVIFTPTGFSGYLFG